MKTLQTLQRLSKIGRILSNLAFVFSVIGFCGCVAGLVSLGLGGDELIKIGGVTLHGLISRSAGTATGSIAAALSGWLPVCAGEAVLAKFAEVYFKNEVKAGTPFTLPGARELMRLGILTIALPTGCALLGSVAEELVASFMQVEKIATRALPFDTAIGVTLGILSLLGALLCRYGAELQESRGERNHDLGGQA